MVDLSISPLIRCELDAECGMVTLCMQMDGGVNKVNGAFVEALRATVELVLGRAQARGVMLESAHDTFCAGADVDALLVEREAVTQLASTLELHRALRKLEEAGLPLVALIAGSALGAGLELALACHRRVVLDDSSLTFALPAVTFGLIPGCGATQRLPRLLGFRRAIELIVDSQTFAAQQALQLGLVDEICTSVEEMRLAAKRWIEANPISAQPWNRPGFRFPAPWPGSVAANELFLTAAARLYEKGAGAALAPKLALSAMQEGGHLTLERALEVEARYFVQALRSDQAQDMLRTLWVSRRAAEKLQGLPRRKRSAVRRVAVVGAGMMGAELAFVAARCGYAVSLKDVETQALSRALQRCRKLAETLAAASERPDLLARIRPTLDMQELAGADLLIEAVFENLPLKQAVLDETESLLAPLGIWASNTSALPLRQIAERAVHPTRVLGLHFFSPVHRMALVEVVKGPWTSEETLARALAFCRELGKVPIVVNDCYGFYTTRVFISYVLEGMVLLAQGVSAQLIEWSARAAGMIVGPLQVADEVSLELARHIVEQRRQFGEPCRTSPLAETTLVQMLDQHGRAGRAAGAGFYVYVEGKRRQLWPGLTQLGQPSLDGSVEDVEAIGRRLLLVQAVEAVRTLEQGVIERPRDADVGAVLGLGFAPTRGGPLTYLERLGLERALRELEQLAVEAGPQFEPPELLRRMVSAGQTRFAHVAAQGS